MPELPEVETIARALDEAVTGRHIVSARLTAPDLYRRASRRVGWGRGSTIAGVRRIGKAILFTLRVPGGDERAMVIHLGMTGRFSFHVAPGEERILRGDTINAAASDAAAARHRHIRWRLRDGAVLDYIDPRRFGYVYLGPMEGLRAVLNMGPDPFEIRPRELTRALTGRRAPVKALLLDQRIVAGLGNICVDEALFMAGVHPLTPGDVAAARAPLILQAARRVLRRSIRFNGTTLRDYRRLDGDSGEFQKRLRVYGRDGEPCVCCGETIEKGIVGGRGTHACPRCQPRPGPHPRRR